MVLGSSPGGSTISNSRFALYLLGFGDVWATATVGTLLECLSERRTVKWPYS